MFSKFDEESQKVLLTAKREMTLLKHPYVGSEHLLLAILSNKDLDLTNRLNSYGITYEKFKNEVIKVIGKGTMTNTWFLYTPLLKRVIEGATLDCKDQNKSEVTVNHLFISLLEEGDGVAIRILMGMNYDIDELYENFSSDFVVKKNGNSSKLLIEEYSLDLNKKCSDGYIDPVIGRDKEINSLIEVLSRRYKNNPLLIGDAGVGKTSIVEELANRINNDLVPNNLKNKRILSVAMSSLVAGTKYRGEFEEKINKILKEVEENEDIILFIDEIHTLVGAGGAEGAIDASNILKPALARGKLKLIGATTIEEYNQFLEKDKALDRRFQKIIIKEPTPEKTREILKSIAPLYESFHNTKISNEIIDYIVGMTDKYIRGRKYPDKAIDILDEVCASTILMKNNTEKKYDKLCQELRNIKNNKKEAIIKENFDKARELKIEQNKIETKLNKLKLKFNEKSEPKVITKDMILNVISKKVNIPIYESNDSSKKLVKISNKLKRLVYGQDEAIKLVSDFTKRYQLGISNNKIHSFLFIGQTGVGKTLLVKEYASLVYSEDSYIRMDMSEYKESHSISKIIGSPPGYVGYDDSRYLLEKIRNNPYCVLLLDEIEKAHPDVIKLFLQILDNGLIKDSKGNKVYFNNVVIFMTSNIGCDKKQIGFSNDDYHIKDELTNFFGVEFINRIDDILIFNSLTEDIIREIIKKKLVDLKKMYLEKNIKLTFSKKIVDDICNKSNFEKYGARKIDKIIDKEINNYIVDKVLSGNNKILVNDAI